MSYCEICGKKLELKFLKNEGMIPFCSFCNQYRFDKYNVAVSMVVLNATKDKVLLIQQYGSQRYILVAGYVNKGESAEDACKRELLEETGLEIKELFFQKTKYYEKTNTLMINFLVITKDEMVTPNEEIDSYQWFTLGQAKDNIAKNSLAEEFFKIYYDGVEHDEI